MEKKLRIGFDFDGVLAYNPVRIFRLPVSLLTRLLLRKGSLSYLSYYPKTQLEKFFWKILHWTSFFPALGFSELKKLLAEGKIEGYIISGRFAIIKGGLRNWLKKHQAEKLFAGCFINEKNEPPHLFKEKMLEKLGLDIYVEDNWDIVQYLNFKFQNPNVKSSSNSKFQNPTPKILNNSRKTPATSNQQPATSIHWIYNILDRLKPYKNKHPYLKKFLERVILPQSDSGKRAL